MTAAALPRRAASSRAALPSTHAALVAVTLAAALGMGRLFSGIAFFPPLLAVALAVHGVSLVCRRRGVALGVEIVAALSTIALASIWALIPDATTFGIPTPSTFATAWQEIGDAARQFSKVVAPAPVSDGFLLSAAIGVGLAAHLAEWAAFRLRAPVEACVPSFALFILTGALGVSRHRIPALMLYIAAVVVFVLLFRLGNERSTAWFTGSGPRGERSVMQTGLAVGIAALLLGVVLGPHLPGAGDPPLVAYRGKDRPGKTNRATVSPLVDIRGRLVDHAGIEVFTVKSAQPRYWRLTSLDKFDGAIWSSEDTYRSVKEKLPVAPGVPAPSGRTLRQVFEIKGLSTIWLPAAFRPVSLVDRKDVIYNAESASFITTRETAESQSYRVESDLPLFAPADLRRSQGVPQEIADRYLELPSISPAVRRLAQQIAGAQPTPFDRARALQDHFRKNFEYDLDVGPGHSTDALDNFLLRDRRGYCEQFAGAYAVLARAVGLPARIAVGFTQGELNPSDSLFHVKDENAHAWPEVYLTGFGWVPFEPTPGRGQPGTEQYTGVQPQQAAPGAPDTATTQVPTTAGASPTSTPPTTVRPGETEVDAGDLDAADGLSVGERVLIAIAAIVMLFALYAVAIVALKRRRAAKRLAAARTPEDLVLLAWSDAHGLLRATGHGRRRAETLAEYARRASASQPLEGDPGAAALARLAEGAGVASYASGGLDRDDVAQARRDAEAVEEVVRRRARRSERIAWALDPRPLVTGDRDLAPPGDARSLVGSGARPT